MACSLHSCAEINTGKSKPQIILDYDKWKAGVDTLDQIEHCYIAKRKSRRWRFALFCNFLEIAEINAYTVSCSKTGASHKRPVFLQELASSLLPINKIAPPTSLSSNASNSSASF